MESILLPITIMLLACQSYLNWLGIKRIGAVVDKDEVKRPRCFVITYTASSKDKRDIYHSNLNITMTDGTYPTKKIVLNDVTKTYPNVNCDNILITNIIEMSESDYNNWMITQ